jgi:hypothetical protein
VDYRLSRWGLKRPHLFAPLVDSRLAAAVPVQELTDLVASRLEKRLAA